MPQPSLDEIEVSLRAAGAIAVIVEGEAVAGDAWIYGDMWFGDRARELLFFAQDGWPSVVDAVAQFRARLPGFPIFGILDRDFTPDIDLSALEPNGIYRSRLYSVENHLLDPTVWHKIYTFRCRIRGGGLPAGWTSVGEVADQIARAYLRCVERSAFNRSIALILRGVGELELVDTPKYSRSVGDKRLVDPHRSLVQWGELNGLPPTLADTYDQSLDQLRAAGPAVLPTVVDGKIVMQELLNAFHAEAPRLSGWSRVEYQNHYFNLAPDPPDEIREMVDRLVASAAEYVRGH